MSEEDEITMGRKAHPDVVRQFGRYDDDVLAGYVQRVGEQLASKSHRSDLIYRFTVLDTDQVNAFALPGGYIYVTRGLLAYLNSEAELAAVLGHEIGHVTARHSVRQLSMAQATGLGFGIGSIFVPELRTRAAQDVFNVLSAAFIRGYGRENELEADRLGAQYLARSNFDPQAMINVIGVLKDQEEFEIQLAKEENREPRVYHGVFSTHPDNDRRLQEVVATAGKPQGDGAGVVDRDAYFDVVDGLVFGDSEKDGIRRGRHFYHKELGIALSFPDGWRIRNQPSQVFSHPTTNDAFIRMTVEDIDKRISPEEFMKSRLNLDKLSEDYPIMPNELNGYSAVAKVKTPFGVRPVRFNVIYIKDKAYIVGSAAKNDELQRIYEDVFTETVESFHRLKKKEYTLAEALTLRVIEADENTTISGLAKKSGIQHHPADQLRLLNQFFPVGEPEVGQKLKIVE